jgi:hypothetical protein
MPKDYKPPREAADTYTRYKAHYEGERALKPEMLEAADRDLKAGATVGQLATWTGLTPEVFRRRARALGVERKRPPTVGKLTAAPPGTPLAAATTRVRVSAVKSPDQAEPTEPTAKDEAALPLPEMSAREFRKVIARAMSRAKPDQRERLNLTAQTAERMGRNKNHEVLKAAFEMDLLKHDEVYAEPTTTDEAAASERPVSSEEKTP